MSRTKGSYVRGMGTGVLQGRIWQSMRIMRRFTAAELATVSECSASASRQYVRALTVAGFVKQMNDRQRSRDGIDRLFILLRDTGPLAPMVRGDGNGVTDRNTGIGWDRNGKPDNEAAPAGEADA